MSLIAKLDEGLAVYYKTVGDDSYYENGKKGKFKHFCDDNGFEENDVCFL